MRRMRGEGDRARSGSGGSLSLFLEPAALEDSFSLPSHVSSLGSLSRETLGSIQDKIKWWRDGYIKPRMRSERRLVTPKGEEAQGRTLGVTAREQPEV